ncbi:unnamed protein product [Fraxinus pennsylvanica]|uniref:Uncharacterized protein n=1 Tax=Fraxinus pennsylvanica TaxID=56036 RepID=A0AAD2EFU8_9LAMI|nr:unnamed protein product [Fraxinus pennsylvanica]
MQLAALWPSGIMDTHFIKRAICRAKERRKAISSSQQKEQEKKKKKLLAPKADEPVQGKASNISQPSHVQETLVPNSRDYSSSLINKLVHSAAVANSPVRVPTTFANGLNSDMPKLEKTKGQPNILKDEAREEEAEELRKCSSVPVNYLA